MRKDVPVASGSGEGKLPSVSRSTGGSTGSAAAHQRSDAHGEHKRELWGAQGRRSLHPPPCRGASVLPVTNRDCYRRGGWLQLHSHAGWPLKDGADTLRF